MRRLPLQMLALAAAMLALALAVNALHPEGLELGRDYFKKPEHPFRTVSTEEFRDYAEFADAPEGDVVYLDARRTSQYQKAHVPGAWSVPRNDAAALEAALEAVLAPATAMVVIYCQGGNCEDSIFLAEDLVYRHDVDPSIVHIFEPGWEEWQKIGGATRSGKER